MLSESLPLVLIVDDDRRLDATMAPLFAGHGMRAVWVATGTAAHGTARRLVPDVIVIGPVTSGAEAVLLIERFRSEAATRHVPVIALTRAKNRTLLDRLVDAGATEIVLYPTLPAAIFEAAHRHARRTPAAREVLELRRQLAEARDRSAELQAGVTAMRGRLAILAMRMQATRLAMLAVESSGDCIAANRAACAASGRPPEQLVGEKAWAIARAAGRPTLEEAWPQLLETGVFEGTATFEPPAGAPIAVAVYAATDVLPGVHVIAFDPQG